MFIIHHFVNHIHLINCHDYLQERIYRHLVNTLFENNTNGKHLITFKLH